LAFFCLVPLRTSEDQNDFDLRTAKEVARLRRTGAVWCHRSAYSQTCAVSTTGRIAQVSAYRDLWHLNSKLQHYRSRGTFVALLDSASRSAILSA
jgi:hypothetical protein